VCGCNQNADSIRALSAKGYETLTCDFSDGAALDVLCTVLASRRIDVLVNAAGIAYSGLFFEMTASELRRVIDVDLTAAMLLSKAVVPGMLAAHSGRIVNVSSMWGVVGASCEVAYSAAKAGLIGFTKALARELGPNGITVNAVAPGVIDTPMLKNLSEQDKLDLAQSTPLGRLGTPQDVARAVSYLIEADFVTAQILGVDGGFI